MTQTPDYSDDSDSWEPAEPDEDAFPYDMDDDVDTHLDVDPPPHDDLIGTALADPTIFLGDFA